MPCSFNGFSTALTSGRVTHYSDSTVKYSGVLVCARFCCSAARTSSGFQGKLNKGLEGQLCCAAALRKPAALSQSSDACKSSCVSVYSGSSACRQLC
eukprot:3978-Heterococcus_DN1.PRE.1